MQSWLYGALADGIVVVHILFVGFVIWGAALVAWRPILAWIHVPAVTWAALLEFNGWICPLTPLEQSLRAAGGEVAYRGDFVDHYLLPLLYPAGLTPGLQVALGVAVIGVNALSYGWMLRRSRVRRQRRSAT